MSKLNEKEVVSQMIELYRDMPYLWNKNDKNYTNERMRNEGMTALLNVYKNIYEDATLKMVKKKIQNLRTYYLRELKKVIVSKQSAGEAYVPSIWYYNNFSFLDSIISTDSFIENDEDEITPLSFVEDTELTELSNSSSTSEHYFKKMRTEDPLNHKHENGGLNKTRNEDGGYSKTRIEDGGYSKTRIEDWEIVGKSIGIQLRDLDKKQNAIARKLISDVIFYGSLNKLTEESFVGVNTTAQLILPQFQTQS